MKFLLFNLIVTGSLIYLLSDAGVIHVDRSLVAEQGGDIAERAAETVVAARRTKEQYLRALKEAMDQAGVGTAATPEDMKAIQGPVESGQADAAKTEEEPASGPEENFIPAAPVPRTLLRDDAEASAAPEPEAIPPFADDTPAAPDMTAVEDRPPAVEESTPEREEPELTPPPSREQPADDRTPVRVVDTSDPAVIRRRAEVLGEDFVIAGAEPKRTPPPATRRPPVKVVPSKAVAGLTPLQRSRELDRLALDMELMFAERVGQ